MEVGEKLLAIRENVSKVFVGGGVGVDLALTAILARGHILIEDVPGIGKTTLARALAASLGCGFRRIQFTPDVMPSDIVGFSAPGADGEFRYRPGAIMEQVVLADEINRTSPKTQSALLEVMQEGQATVDGVAHPLPSPFVVLATQNPVEQVGTYPLPEAQLDRFLIRISFGYPTLRQEMEILDRHDSGDHADPSALRPVVSAGEVLEMQKDCDGITCSGAIKEYITVITARTRTRSDLALGASPRGAIALMRASKAAAMLAGRSFVLPDDVKKVATAVLAHRIVLRPEARLRDMTPERVIGEVMGEIRVPDAG